MPFIHLYLRGSGVGTGPEISTFIALAKLVTSNPEHWAPDDEGNFVPFIMSFTPSSHDLLLFRAYGVIMRLLLIWKKCFLPFSPALLMYFVEGFDAATDLKFLQLVAPRIADRLATWPPPTEIDNSGRHQLALTVGKDPMNLILHVLPNLQVRYLFVSACDTDAITNI